MSRSTMPDSNPPGDLDQTYRDAVIAAMGHRLAAAGPRTRQRLLHRQAAPDDTKRDESQEAASVDWWPSLISRADDEGWDVPKPEYRLFGVIPPWQECVTAARRFALLGAAASCGFAVVLFGLSQHVGAPHRKTASAHAAEEASLEVTPPPALLASAIRSGSAGSVGAAAPATTTGPAAATAVTPAAGNVAAVAQPVVAQPVVAGPMVSQSVEPRIAPPAQVPAPAAAAAGGAEQAAADTPSPIEAAAPADHAAGASVPTSPKPARVNAPAGAGPAGRGEVQPAAQRPSSPWLHPRPWRPGRAAPVLLAHAAAKSHARPTEPVNFDVPRWLAEHNPPRPRVVVMSEPPHFLTQPADMTAAQARASAPPAQAVTPHEQPAARRAPVVVASSAYGSAPFGWPANRPNYGGYYGPPQGSYYPSYYPPPYGGYYGGGAP